MPVTVMFVYDEQTQKWDPLVEGTANDVEAKQAFNAVVLTCQQLQSQLLKHNKSETVGPMLYRIIPAV